MQYWRCKCGQSEAFGSDWPRDCEGCKKCNTTYAQSPEHHKTPIPHDLKIQYDTDTGKPDHYICKRCYTHIKLEDVEEG